MKQTHESIRTSINELRDYIDSQPHDEIQARFAQLAETVLRWSIEDVEDWLPPLAECKAMADVVRNDPSYARSLQ